MITTDQIANSVIMDLAEANLYPPLSLIRSAIEKAMASQIAFQERVAAAYAAYQTALRARQNGNTAAGHLVDALAEILSPLTVPPIQTTEGAIEAARALAVAATPQLGQAIEAAATTARRA